jgi:NAD(P)H dehydrogenase (quinone)
LLDFVMIYPMNQQPYILILYYSRYGAVKALAEAIAEGVESITGISARLRTVPPLTTTVDTVAPAIPVKGDLYAELDDLRDCVGLALGSPTRFGNMAAPLKYFIDQSSELWLSGALADKPATVFSSSSTLHGGQETTLLMMMMPLFHHGMLIMGAPTAEEELQTTTAGGTPYGVTHVTFGDNNKTLSKEERSLAVKVGKRLAQTALKLQS